MFSVTDTIVAIATPPGRGGIGVVRVSGSDAPAIAAQLIDHGGALEPRYATLTTIALDQVVATYFPAPHSYTGEHVVELSAHGSPVVLQAIVQGAIEAGARLAEPGEFTLRAFLNGRMDLMQAEAVADLIDSVTPVQARAAFDQLQGTLTRAIGAIDVALFDLVAKLEASVDFPDEGYHFVEPSELADALGELRARTSRLLADARRGRLVREGFHVAIVGEPNVGKSSLFNALVGASRAIVTAVPGTTRDLVTETVDLEGFRVTLVDTAGRRDTADVVEAEGVARARQAELVSDVILLVIDDISSAEQQVSDSKTVVVLNKCDLRRPERETPHAPMNVVSVSALTSEGLDSLRRRIALTLGMDEVAERPGITNVRHIALVQRADDALARAHAAVLHSAGALSEEFVLADLQDARAALEEISGKRVTDDLLAHIFSRFCIGK